MDRTGVAGKRNGLEFSGLEGIGPAGKWKVANMDWIGEYGPESGEYRN
jgi:hypothetical protein